MSVLRISTEDRRRRLARRHHIATAERVSTLAEAARDVVGLHSSDPVSVFLEAYARLREPSVERIEAALYAERTVARILGMRRTLFVLPLELVPIVLAACTEAIAGRERRRTLQFLAEAAVGGPDPGAWLDEVEESAARALATRGDAFTTDLYPDEPRLGEKLVLARDSRYAATITVGTRVLPLLAAHGRAVRGRPRGTWISSQYRWHPIGDWFPDGITRPATDEAQARLVELWLRSFGPGTAGDVRWWSGLTAREVTRATQRIGALEVDLESGGRGLILPDDVEPEAATEPWAALLPALDSTVMGWADRSWFLGSNAPVLFDQNGNAGPTVWWGGRVVGAWAQRRDGEIAFRLLEDVGAEGCERIGAEAGRLQDWLGAVRFTPRFRSPIERELAG